MAVSPDYAQLSQVVDPSRQLSSYIAWDIYDYLYKCPPQAVSTGHLLEQIMAATYRKNLYRELSSQEVGHTVG